MEDPQILFTTSIANKAIGLDRRVGEGREAGRFGDEDEYSRYISRRGISISCN